ncbi:MAG: L-2-amino-thiazoline-4-carboxylic acid hydrolase [Eubacteriales bacterium]|nr:L-2-amino-thiazoline-4-carboxylic acid hydrolase [Eubacteriales bacterium]
MKNTICEKFMWCAMKGTILKFLGSEWPDGDLKSIRSRFREEYQKMRAEVDDIGPMTKNPLRICLTGGIIWLAAYEACDGKMDEELFSRMITNTMESPVFRMAFGAKDPFDRKKQEKKVAAFKTANEISGSEFNWHTDYTPGRDETEYFCTYRRCGLCALGRKYGHPELIPYMCQMDYISIDMMGAVLYRTQTLAAGGECCDFHVVKKDSKWIKH